MRSLALLTPTGSVGDLCAGDERMRLIRAGVGHILRLLATYQWLREISPDVFANNRLSAQLSSGKTLEQLRDSYGTLDLIGEEDFF